MKKKIQMMCQAQYSKRIGVLWVELRSENLNRMVRKSEEASDGVSGGKSALEEGPARASFLEMVVLGGGGG